MIKRSFRNFSTRIRSCEATAAQEASQKMGAPRGDVGLASGFRSSDIAATFRTAVTSKSGAPGPAFCATQSLE